MLGTKATRASIIDTLFKRGYIEGSSITVTSFGMSVYNALNDNANMIVSEETTRRLEEDMEHICEQEKHRGGSGRRQADAARGAQGVRQQQEQDPKEMQKGISETEAPLGKCLKDGGNLVIRKSRLGKQFVACENYPKCTETYSIPQIALVVPTGKVCEFAIRPW